MHLRPGTSGLLVGVGIFLLIWIIAHWRTPEGSYHFDAHGQKGSFEKLLSLYLRVAEVIVGLASGSIVLLVGSSAFRTSGRLPWVFASPLFILAFCVLYGILFMLFEILNYEGYRHQGAQSYTRFRYARNQALGISTLLCFVIGYFALVWMIVNSQ